MTQQHHRKTHKGNTLVILLTGILLGAGITCLRRRRQRDFRDDRMWFI